MNTITENNKLIAEFMGSDFMNKNIFINRLPEDFLENSDCYRCFHNSFDWLMEVVEKIEQFIEKNKQTVNTTWVHIMGKGCIIEHANKTISAVCSEDGKPLSKIEAVYNAVVSFIEWYNSAEKETKTEK